MQDFRRLILVFIVFVLIFTLCGCGKRENLDKLKVETDLSNKIDTFIYDEYNKDVAAIEGFNVLFFEALRNPLNYNADVEKYSPNRSILDTVTYIHEKIDEYKENVGYDEEAEYEPEYTDSEYGEEREINNIYYMAEDFEIDGIESYNFMQEDGTVLEMIIFENAVINVVMEIQWSDGLIVSYEYSY